MSDACPHRTGAPPSTSSRVRWGSRGGQAPRDDLGPRGDADLAVGAADVGLDGVDAEVELATRSPGCCDPARPGAARRSRGDSGRPLSPRRVSCSAACATSLSSRVPAAALMRPRRRSPRPCALSGTTASAPRSRARAPRSGRSGRVMATTVEAVSLTQWSRSEVSSSRSATTSKQHSRAARAVGSTRRRDGPVWASMVRSPTATMSWGVTTATVATAGTVDGARDGSLAGAVTWWGDASRAGWEGPLSPLGEFNESQSMG